MTDGIFKILKKKRQFADMKVFAGDFTDGITEKFKPESSYSDVPYLPSE
jgi:ABC-type oligopeptide transport system substrate-binding subunit